MSNYRMVPGLMTEELDQELLVCDTDLAVVHRVSGPAADVLRQVLATAGAPVALEDDEVTSGLVDAGVLVTVDAPEREVDRRSFVRAAAAVSTIGIVTLALPRAAAASSSVDFNSSSDTPDAISVATGLTGIDYYGSGGTLDIRKRSVDVRWEELSEGEGGGPFTFNVRITGSTNTWGPIIRTGLPSTTQAARDGTPIYLEDWAGGETITVEFVTQSVTPTVTGNQKTQTRDA